MKKLYYERTVILPLIGFGVSLDKTPTQDFVLVILCFAFVFKFNKT